MRPELNTEFKEKLFVQYWGQKAFANGNFTWSVDSNQMKHAPISVCFLLLRKLSSLTDDESIWIAKMSRPKSLWLHDLPYAKTFATKDITHAHPSTFLDSLLITDYLRSIGVALPFMGYSVEELVDCGWIRLIDQ